jgi:hypothetical protein
MQKANFTKAGLLALLLSLAAVSTWEFYLRHQGLMPTYDDNPALWADKRAMVYEPKDQTTVFIGSSRIKFDLDIPTWQNNTGNHVVQLSNVGSDPKPYLEDLASDKNFKGNLIIDVTEGLFFSEYSKDDFLTDKKINYYKKVTPTQRFSFLVDRLLESQFVFLDQYFLSFNSMLNRLKIPKRKGVFAFPHFPMDFDLNTFSRQSYMDTKFVSDTSLQNQVKNIWLFFAQVDKDPPVSGKRLDTIFDFVKTSVDKIKARGGHVLFVRTPSSGAFRQAELKGYPRDQYWNRLLAVTGCPGIYYEDYPAIAHFECPEWSHLKPDDAVIFTINLISILREEKKWSINSKPK